MGNLTKKRRDETQNGKMELAWLEGEQSEQASKTDVYIYTINEEFLMAFSCSMTLLSLLPKYIVPSYLSELSEILLWISVQTSPLISIAHPLQCALHIPTLFYLLPLSQSKWKLGPELVGLQQFAIGVGWRELLLPINKVGMILFSW